MMVLASIYLAVSTSLPTTAEIKPVEIWLLISLVYPCCVILLNILIQVFIYKSIKVSVKLSNVTTLQKLHGEKGELTGRSIKVSPGSGKPIASPGTETDKKLSTYSEYFDQLFAAEVTDEMTEGTDVASARPPLLPGTILEMIAHIFLPLGLIFFIVIYFSIYSSV